MALRRHISECIRLVSLVCGSDGSVHLGECLEYGSLNSLTLRVQVVLIYGFKCPTRPQSP